MVPRRAHRNDEANIIPPDIMFATETIRELMKVLQLSGRPRRGRSLLEIIRRVV